VARWTGSRPSPPLRPLAWGWPVAAGGGSGDPGRAFREHEGLPSFWRVFTLGACRPTAGLALTSCAETEVSGGRSAGARDRPGPGRAVPAGGGGALLPPHPPPARGAVARAPGRRRLALEHRAETIPRRSRARNVARRTGPAQPKALQGRSVHGAGDAESEETAVAGRCPGPGGWRSWVRVRLPASCPGRRRPWCGSTVWPEARCRCCVSREPTARERPGCLGSRIPPARRGLRRSGPPPHGSVPWSGSLVTRSAPRIASGSGRDPARLSAQAPLLAARYPVEPQAAFAVAADLGYLETCEGRPRTWRTWPEACGPAPERFWAGG